MQWMLTQDCWVDEEESYEWELERAWMTDTEEEYPISSGCEEHLYMDCIQSYDNDLEGGKYEAAMDCVTATTIQF